MTPANLAIDGYGYSERCKELDDLPPLEVNEKKYYIASSMPLSKVDGKERKGWKILTPNKLLTRLQTLLAEKKAGNNSNKLKNEIRQVVYLLYQHSNNTKNV